MSDSIIKKIKFQGLFKSKKTSKTCQVFTSSAVETDEKSKTVTNFRNKSGCHESGSAKIHYFGPHTNYSNNEIKNDLERDIDIGYSKLLLSNAQFDIMEESNLFTQERKGLSGIFEQIKSNV